MDTASRPNWGILNACGHEPDESRKLMAPGRGGMPTVHMIHGYIGAGKTTFARQLEGEAPALRFTHDEWMARLYGDDPPVDRYGDCFRRVSEQIGALWPQCVTLGLDVVLDLGFWSRRQRDETRALAAALGASCRLYRLSCPDDEAWRRIERRNASLAGNLFIARNTFEVLRARFEPLETDEDRIEVSDANHGNLAAKGGKPP